MTEKIKALCVKYREFIVYILVGGLTTLVSWGSKFLWGAVFYPGVALPTIGQTTVLNVVENVSGILFAYFPNRKWVFHSRDPKIFPEFLSFVTSRLGTWGLSYVLNVLLTNVLHIEYHITTVLVSIVVVVANYVVSKFFVFRKKE